MVVLEADHPEIVAAQLKIRLPKAVVVFSLETPGSPGLSRLAYRMVQAGFADYMINLIMVNGETFVVEVPSYFVWTPIVSLAQFDNLLFQGIIKE